MQLIVFFVGFLDLGGITQILQIFLGGNETFQLLVGGFFEIMLMPLRKRIFEISDFVKYRKRRVISAEIYFTVQTL